MTLLEQMNEGIKEAMRNKDSIRLNTLRMLKSKILTVDARGNLPDTDIQKLFKTYLGNLKEELEQFQAINRLEDAKKLESEILIVQEFLPQALSREETQKLLIQAIADVGAKVKKDFGLVMKAIIKLNNSVDGKLVKELADELLTG